MLAEPVNTNTGRGNRRQTRRGSVDTADSATEIGLSGSDPLRATLTLPCERSTRDPSHTAIASATSSRAPEVPYTLRSALNTAITPPVYRPDASPYGVMRLH